MSRRFIFILIFLLAFTLINSLMQGKKTDRDQLKNGDFVILTSKNTYKRGGEVSVFLKNNTPEDIELEKACPSPPLEVYRYTNGEWMQLNAQAQLDCTKSEKNITIKANTEHTVSLKDWSYELFSELGRYQVRLFLAKKNKTLSSNEFVIEKESFLGLIWREMLYRPIYNTLMFLTWSIGGHNLGIGILLLTLLIRTILLLPSQKALRAQKRLQEIQPKLEEIKKRYKDNQERIAEETLKLWRQHKANPFGSCLPLLIQFPILIALFYVIRDGLSPNNIHLLYEPLKNIALANINVQFLSLDLTKINTIILPLIVGGLQFLQMKLQLYKKKSDSKAEQKDVQEQKKKDIPDMQMVNKTMIYFLPVMIALFTASVPAGVGLYWGISTLYSIGQQMIVNREKRST